jgi:hypothetical protein
MKKTIIILLLLSVVVKMGYNIYSVSTSVSYPGLENILGGILVISLIALLIVYPVKEGKLKLKQ